MNQREELYGIWLWKVFRNIKIKKYLNIPNIKFLKSNHYCRISILEIHDNHLNSLRIWPWFRLKYQFWDLSSLSLDICWLVSTYTYPIVCWVSKLNRKAEVKSLISLTQTTVALSLPTPSSPCPRSSPGSRSPWSSAIKYQTMENISQDR